MIMLKYFYFLLLLIMTSHVMAAPLTWNEKRYSHFSDQEPLKDMLQALVSTQSMPLIVSPRVTDVVSLHYKNRLPRDIFNELIRTHNLIWFFDGDTLYVYKESEAQRGSISMKTMSPREFSAALKRLNVLEDQYHWEVSSIDNMIYFSGPERFVSAVLNLARLADSGNTGRPQVYKWTDSRGQINYSNERPLEALDINKDAATIERFSGFDVVDIIDR